MVGGSHDVSGATARFLSPGAASFLAGATGGRERPH